MGNILEGAVNSHDRPIKLPRIKQGSSLTYQKKTSKRLVEPGELHSRFVQSDQPRPVSDHFNFSVESDKNEGDESLDSVSSISWESQGSCLDIAEEDKQDYIIEESKEQDN